MSCATFPTSDWVQTRAHLFTSYNLPVGLSDMLSCYHSAWGRRECLHQFPARHGIPRSQTGVMNGRSGGTRRRRHLPIPSSRKQTQKNLCRAHRIWHLKVQDISAKPRCSSELVLRSKERRENTTHSLQCTLVTLNLCCWNDFRNNLWF